MKLVFSILGEHRKKKTKHDSYKRINVNSFNFLFVECSNNINSWHRFNQFGFKNILS